MPSTTDIKWINQAIALAKRAWGQTSPNPLVGAVIVRQNELVGRGWHERAGEPHAEVNAIRSAGDKAKDSIIYVTLEPCSTTGRTPPCVEAIKKANIKRVVIGALDPNPKHAGRGVDILKDAGIEVETGVEEKRCVELNESFNKWITTGKPFIHLKMAMTLDGKIATNNGNSRWITGPDARKRVHRLRQWADAIMVGGSTARLDTPSLNARNAQNDVVKTPRRIIVSALLTSSELAESLPAGPLPEVIHPSTPEQWHEELKRLGSENVTAILVEGGGELASTILSAKIVDRVEFHIAPKILGGRDSRPVVGGENPTSLSEALNLTNVTVTQFGKDICVTGEPQYI